MIPIELSTVICNEPFNFFHSVREQGAQLLDIKCHCIKVETAWASKMNAGKMKH